MDIKSLMRGFLGALVSAPTVAVLTKYAWFGEVWSISILVSMTAAILTYFGFDVKINTSLIKLNKH